MKNKWLVAALIASLVLNVAAIGFLIGAASRPAHWSRGHLDATVGLTHLLRFLPNNRRATVLEADAPNGHGLRRDLRVSVREMRRAQRAMHEAMTAEPFNADALAATLATFREHFAASQGRSHEAFVAIAERLTPAERRQFVEQIEKMGRSDKRRRHAKQRQAAEERQ